MNKLGKNEYILLIAETLVDTYGKTLCEGDTDINLAKAVVKKLTPYLYFGQDISLKEFRQTKRDRLMLAGYEYDPNSCDIDFTEQEIKDAIKRRKTRGY